MYSIAVNKGDIYFVDDFYLTDCVFLSNFFPAISSDFCLLYKAITDLL